MAVASLFITNHQNLHPCRARSAKLTYFNRRGAGCIHDLFAALDAA